MLQETFDKAEEHLACAFRMCPFRAVRQRQKILTYLIPVRLMLIAQRSTIKRYEWMSVLVLFVMVSSRSCSLPSDGLMDTFGLSVSVVY